MSEAGKVPKPEDPDVLAFLQNFGLSAAPVYVEFEDRGYDPNFCHVSAKHAAQQHGGRRAHGWAIWQFTELVIAEFHSVWENADGALVDVTPPKWNAKNILFVEDLSLQITTAGGMQMLYTNRSSVPDLPYWWLGQPVPYERFGMPNNNVHLVRYCSQLGMVDTSML
ncbi:MAG: hypothetical protein WDM79_00585 [Terricaulis sp.]